MKIRRRHSGKWAGLTAITISGILNRSYYYTKKILKQKSSSLNRELTLQDIGDIIYEQKRLEERDSLNKYFISPSVL